MIGPACINFLDVVREGRGIVNQQMKELVGCRFSSEEFEFMVDSLCPSQDDTNGDLKQGCSVSRKKTTEAVGGAEDIQSHHQRDQALISRCTTGQTKAPTPHYGVVTYTIEVCFHQQT